jgi:hypothetical protein
MKNILIDLSEYFHKNIHMSLLINIFIKNKESKLRFGDRVVVLYRYGRSTFDSKQKQGSAC